MRAWEEVNNMKYFYNNAMSKIHYIKCLRSAKEWLNQDLPDIYRLEDKTKAIEVTFPEYKVFVYANDKDEADILERFVFLSTGKEAEVYY